MSRTIAGLTVCFVCATSMGCIITKDPSYTPPANTPAVVLSHPDSPMNRFTVIDLNGEAGPDGGVPSQTIDFVATVYDPDVDQPLVGLVFLDHNPDDPLGNRPRADEIAISETALTTTRRVEFSVVRSDLPRGCHVLELHVARRFVNFTNPVPAPDPDPDAPLDLGRGVWWLNVRDDPEDTLIPVDECLSRPAQ